MTSAIRTVATPSSICTISPGTGLIGDAVSANGVNQYVSIPAVNLSATKAVTWTAWVNRTYSPTGGDTLFENSANFNNSTTGFGFFPDDGTDCPTSAPMMTGVNGDVGYTLNCYAQPSSGVWHHIAVVYDKSQPATSVISLYLDGVLQTPAEYFYTATNTNSFGTNPLYLFSRGGTTEFAAGEVDDLRLYNRVLSATEIEEIYLMGNSQLVSLAVTPASTSIAKGTTQQFTATGTYNNGATQNLTSSVTWGSTGTSVATITTGGLATGAGVGGTTIQATSGAITGSTGLTVTAPVLISIAVTPADPLIASTTTQQFTATGTFSDSSTQNLTGSVTWSSSNTAAATITSTGLATGVATGISTIQATAGSINGSTSLTVTATLVSITVTPGNASIAQGLTQQFTATGVFSDTSSLNLTGSVTWSSLNTAAATITSGGLATAVAAGSTTIQASMGGTSGSTGLTVTAPALVSIAVTPANSSAAIGATQQFTATGTYSDTSTQNLTSLATWASTNTAATTITSGGLATGVAIGSTTIQATSGSISGSTNLTVTPPGAIPTQLGSNYTTLSSTSLSVSGTVAAGSALILQATGRGFDAATGFSISDTQGNGWWQVGADLTASGAMVHCEPQGDRCIATWIVASAKASGSDTVTLSWTGAAQYVYLSFTQWTGQAADPWDGSGATAGNGNSPANTGPASGHSGNPNDLVLAACGNSLPVSPGSGFTALDTSYTGYLSEYKIGAGNSPATCTWSGSNFSYAIEVVTLRPAGSYTSLSRRQAQSLGATGTACNLEIDPHSGG